MISKNKPCPCGSGKLYKRCHYGKMSEKELLRLHDNGGELTIETLIEKNHQSDFLLTLAALQLDPKNHGKNVRFEELVAQILKEGKDKGTGVHYDDIVELFNRHHQFHHLEDPVTSLFTENIIFFSGNYTVYPGISQDGTLILNTFLESIFIKKNTLSQQFKDKVSNAATLLLAISEAISRTAGHDRYLKGDGDDRPINVPDEKYLMTLKAAAFFSNEYFEEIIKLFDIPKETIDNFCVSSADLNEDYHPEDSVLIQKPIFKARTGYIVLLPSKIISALVHFIKIVARDQNCETELLETYHKWQWNKTVEYCYEMGWQQTTIELPEPPQGLHVTEGIFRFDNEKLAYVCLVKPRLSLNNADQESEAVNVIEEDENLEGGSHPNTPKRDKCSERSFEVIEYLTKLNEPDVYRYFTFFVLGGIGETHFFIWSKPDEGNQSLTLSFADFETIIFAGKVKRLTLWKFAKAYLKACGKTRFAPFTSLLDAYVMYKEQKGSLLPSDHEAPNLMVVGLDMSAEFSQDALQSRDPHAVKRLENKSLFDAPVKKHKDYAPIYSEREFSLNNRLVVESYTFPLWIINTQAENQTAKDAANDFIEAIAFWMYKLAPYINAHLNKMNHLPIEINVKLAEQFIGLIQPFEWGKQDVENIDLKVRTEDRVIHIEIPFEMSHSLITEDNAGERWIMKSILSGFNELLKKDSHSIMNTNVMEKAINGAIPLGRAKMILFIDASKDPRLLHTKLVPTQYIDETETSFILDNLVSYIKPAKPIPAEISTVKEKGKLCNSIVSSLVQEIQNKLKKYDAKEMLQWLMEYNERYVFNREFREIKVPAKIACFSSFPDEVESYLEEERKIVPTALAVRCLIEFVAADPQYGDSRMNIDGLDELIALMNEVTQWGVIGDAVHFGMDNPGMGLLPSGRIGMSHDFFDNYLKIFGEARAGNEVHSYMNAFDKKMKIATEEKVATYTPEVKEIDDAFYSEWDITMTKIMYFKRALIETAMKKKESVMFLEEAEFKKMITENNDELTDDDLNAGIRLLTLEKRESVSKPPIGFEKEDIYPWRYNRALSYIRRPIIKLIHSDDGKTYYYWGFRHILASGENLRILAMSGRLKAKEGGLLGSLLAQVNADKGKDFRNQALKWLKENSTLRLVDYEVTIKKDGHLIADKDYGDIDILAIDDVAKIIYPIECKSTSSARVIHEMKTELDKYLGRDGQPGMIQKHVDRDTWLRANREQLRKFVSNPDDYEIRSLILSSEEIPVMYLAKDKLLLPIIAFRTMKREGIKFIQ
jgi:hypothetical protein